VEVAEPFVVQLPLARFDPADTPEGIPLERHPHALQGGGRNRVIADLVVAPGAGVRAGRRGAGSGSGNGGAVPACRTTEEQPKYREFQGQDGISF
jgi:hypothetical protein